MRGRRQLPREQGQHQEGGDDGQELDERLAALGTGAFSHGSDARAGPARGSARRRDEGVTPPGRLTSHGQARCGPSSASSWAGVSSSPSFSRFSAAVMTTRASLRDDSAR